MPNKKVAMEWYDFAEKNLETTLLLNRENHYTDVIAIDIQQAVDFYKRFGFKQLRDSQKVIDRLVRATSNNNPTTYFKFK